MSIGLEAAPQTVPCNPPTEARAARLARFKREQLIVDYLNRGVSVAEIAARVGVGEKRMRAIISEILARRMPGPPEEFVAIQMNRLNEALLVAYSAMSPTNLKAVDRVVKIVRELDRYCGFCIAERRLPETSRHAAAEGDVAFGAALVCSAELALQDFEPAPPDLVASQSKDAPLIATDAAPAGADCPENPAQSLEKVESAPGIGAAWEAGADARPEPAPDGRPDSEAAPPCLVPRLSKDASLHSNVAAPAGGDRPENLPQSLENMESAPGKSRLAGTESGSVPSPLGPYPNGPRRVRISLNGVTAC